MEQRRLMSSEERWATSPKVSLEELNESNKRVFGSEHTGVIDPSGIFEVLLAHRGEVIVDLYGEDKKSIFDSLLNDDLINIELVRRLSDGKLFGIGDYIMHSKGGWRITDFEVLTFDDDSKEVIAWNRKEEGGNSIENL